jgi:hypothetical protein
VRTCEAKPPVVALERLVGGPDVHPQPAITSPSRTSPSPVQQLGAEPLAGMGAGDGELVSVQRRLGGLLGGPE